ncbi:MAG: tetratricopeptide repeat protein [Candidatus Zapsychrus exili]|nr:tetratricopeptide repeat protein [Candidatus Zapsychrus exili]
MRIQQSNLLTAAGKYYRERKKYKEAEKYLSLAIVEYSNNLIPRIELGVCFREQKRYDRAVPMLAQVIDMAGGQATPATIELARCFDDLGLKDKAYKLYKNVANTEYNNLWSYHEAGMWLKENGYLKDAEDVFLKSIAMGSRDSSEHLELAKMKEGKGENKEAEVLRKKYLEPYKTSDGYSKATIVFYNKIVKQVLSSGTKMVCVQYPLRGVESLKNIIENKKYKEQIVFVENKINFEEALSNNAFTDYFQDNFAGDFGHCTRKGNSLIVENISRAVKEIINESNNSL